MKTLSDIVITNNKYKANICYLDEAAVVQMTHDFSLQITSDQDHQTEEIETADSTTPKRQGAGTIYFYILVRNEHIQIELSIVYYLPELDANVISLRILEEKKCELRTMNSLLQIKDKESEIVMKFIQDKGVYPLWEPVLSARNRSNSTIKGAYKNSKSVTKKKFHQRLGHVNYNNLAKMPEMAIGISFEKDISPRT